MNILIDCPNCGTIVNAFVEDEYDEVFCGLCHEDIINIDENGNIVPWPIATIHE